MRTLVIFIVMMGAMTSAYAEVAQRMDFIKIKKYSQDRVTLEACIQSRDINGKPFCRIITDHDYNNDNTLTRRNDYYTGKVLVLAQKFWLEEYGEISASDFTGTTVAGVLLMLIPTPATVILGVTTLIGGTAGRYAKGMNNQASLDDEMAQKISGREFEEQVTNSNEIIIATSDIQKAVQNIGQLLDFRYLAKKSLAADERDARCETLSGFEYAYECIIKSK